MAGNEHSGLIVQRKTIFHCQSGYMKLSFYTLLMLFIFFSCKKAIETTTVATLQKCTSVMINGKPVRCCMDSILLDSRCPSDVVCVWAGTAIASFSLEANNTVYHFSLATLPLRYLYSSDTIIAGYKIKFKNLYPYPTSSASLPNRDNYRAELEIQ